MTISVMRDVAAVTGEVKSPDETARKRNQFFPAEKKGGCCGKCCDSYSRQEDGGEDAALPPWRWGTVVEKARLMSPGSDRWSEEE